MTDSRNPDGRPFDEFDRELDQEWAAGRHELGRVYDDNDDVRDARDSAAAADSGFVPNDAVEGYSPAADAAPSDAVTGAPGFAGQWAPGADSREQTAAGERLGEAWDGARPATGSEGFGEQWAGDNQPETRTSAADEQEAARQEFADKWVGDVPSHESQQTVEQGAQSDRSSFYDDAMYAPAPGVAGTAAPATGQELSGDRTGLNDRAEDLADRSRDEGFLDRAEDKLDQAWDSDQNRPGYVGDRPGDDQTGRDLTDRDLADRTGDNAWATDRRDDLDADRARTGADPDPNADLTPGVPGTATGALAGAELSASGLGAAAGTGAAGALAGTSGILDPDTDRDQRDATDLPGENTDRTDSATRTDRPLDDTGIDRPGLQGEHDSLVDDAPRTEVVETSDGRLVEVDPNRPAELRDIDADPEMPRIVDATSVQGGRAQTGSVTTGTPARYGDQSDRAEDVADRSRDEGLLDRAEDKIDQAWDSDRGRPGYVGDQPGPDNGTGLTGRDDAEARPAAGLEGGATPLSQTDRDAAATGRDQGLLGQSWNAENQEPGAAGYQPAEGRSDVETAHEQLDNAPLDGLGAGLGASLATGAVASHRIDPDQPAPTQEDLRHVTSGSDRAVTDLTDAAPASSRGTEPGYVAARPSDTDDLAGRGVTDEDLAGERDVDRDLTTVRDERDPDLEADRDQAVSEGASGRTQLVEHADGRLVEVDTTRPAELRDIDADPEMPRIVDATQSAGPGSSQPGQTGGEDVHTGFQGAQAPLGSSDRAEDVADRSRDEGFLDRAEDKLDQAWDSDHDRPGYVGDRPGDDQRDAGHGLTGAAAAGLAAAGLGTGAAAGQGLSGAGRTEDNRDLRGQGLSGDRTGLNDRAEDLADRSRDEGFLDRAEDKLDQAWDSDQNRPGYVGDRPGDDQTGRDLTDRDLADRTGDNAWATDRRDDLDADRARTGADPDPNADLTPGVPGTATGALAGAELSASGLGAAAGTGAAGALAGTSGILDPDTDRDQRDATDLPGENTDRTDSATRTDRPLDDTGIDRPGLQGEHDSLVDDAPRTEVVETSDGRLVEVDPNRPAELRDIDADPEMPRIVDATPTTGTIPAKPDWTDDEGDRIPASTQQDRERVATYDRDVQAPHPSDTQAGTGATPVGRSGTDAGAGLTGAAAAGLAAAGIGSTDASQGGDRALPQDAQGGERVSADEREEMRQIADAYPANDHDDAPGATDQAADRISTQERKEMEQIAAAYPAEGRADQQRGQSGAGVDASTAVPGEVTTSTRTGTEGLDDPAAGPGQAGAGETRPADLGTDYAEDIADRQTDEGFFDRLEDRLDAAWDSDRGRPGYVGDRPGDDAGAADGAGQDAGGDSYTRETEWETHGRDTAADRDASDRLVADRDVTDPTDELNAAHAKAEHGTQERPAPRQGGWFEKAKAQVADLFHRDDDSREPRT